MTSSYISHPFNFLNPVTEIRLKNQSITNIVESTEIVLPLAPSVPNESNRVPSGVKQRNSRHSSVPGIIAGIVAAIVKQIPHRCFHLSRRRNRKTITVILLMRM